MIDKYSPLEDVPTSAPDAHTATKQNSMDSCNKEEYSTNDTYQYQGRRIHGLCNSTRE